MSGLDDDIAAARDLFAELGEVWARKMFGGAGLYHDGVMFGLIASGTIHLKATGGFAEDLAAMGSEAFVYRGGKRPVRMSYWRLPDSAMDDPEQAAALARSALACAHAARPPQDPRA